jgi:hypothetical protein
MSKELLDFMTWVNQDKELGYTPIGIERIVNTYTNPKEKQKIMNEEKYNQIIDDAYKNYRSKSKDIDLPENLYYNLIDDLNKNAMFPIDNPSRMLSQEKFINKCKTDLEFSEKWGLKIEERELCLEERNKWSWDNWGITCEMESVLDEQEVPKRAITLTHNETKIEIYE